MAVLKSNTNRSSWIRAQDLVLRARWTWSRAATEEAQQHRIPAGLHTTIILDVCDVSNT